MLKDFLFRPLFTERRKCYQQTPVERRKITSKEASKLVECSIERFDQTISMSGEKIAQLLKEKS